MIWYSLPQTVSKLMMKMYFVLNKTHMLDAKIIRSYTKYGIHTHGIGK